MDWVFFATTLSLVPYFTSRAVVPLFVTVAVARLGSQWSVLAGLSGIDLVDKVPSWATSDWALAVLAIVALLEVVVRKSPSLRELVSLGDAEAKALVVTGLCVALAVGAPAAVAMAAPTAVQMAGFGGAVSWTTVWALLLGAVTWLLASVRRRFYGFLSEIDDDDDLGLQSLLSWAEDGIGFVGVVVALVLPVVALAVAGLTIAGLYVLHLWLRHREESQRVACGSCGHDMVPCGLFCPACGAASTQPCAVGFLGTLRAKPVTDRARHVDRLRAAKRCHRCGERLGQRTLDQRCGACGAPAFASSGELDGYLREVERRLPRTLSILLLLGAVPVLGLIPGIVYYRLTLISALRCYLPRSARFSGRWLSRGINVVLVCFQPLPILGAFVLPLMGFTNYRIYRRSIRRQGRTDLVATAVTP